MNDATAPPTAVSSTYRADIDGLRGIAVLAVVLFHAFPRVVPGGFVGVDVFFVISGFLITGLIDADLTQQRFSFFTFWARRVRRIFPALLTVLAVVLLAGWLYLLPSEFATLKSHIAWGLGFAANFKLNSEVGYFDTAAELKPLLHLWSLAIEEQFYLVWPVVLWVCYRQRINLFAAAAVLTVLSFASRSLLSTVASEAFYLPWTRFWEIQSGGLLALGLAHYGGHVEKLAASARNFFAAAGLVMIAAACFGFNRVTPFPSAYTLLPVAGTALLLFAGRETILSRFALSLRPLVFVGLISFPLYLWHWPLLSFARIILASRVHEGMLDRSVTLTILAASVVMAIATYYLIERPLRREAGRWSWRAPVLLLASCVFLAIMNVSNLQARSSTLHLENIDAAIRSWEHPSPNMIRRTFPDGVPYDELKTHVDRYTLFIGDSHMEQYGPRIAQLSAEHPAETMSSLWMVSGLCLPVDGFVNTQDCKKIRSRLGEILDNPRQFGIERIVWTGYWSAYLEDHMFGQVDAGGSALRGDAMLAARKTAINALLRRITTSGVALTVLLDTPHGNEFDPKMIARSVSGAFMLGTESITRAEARARQGISSDLLASAAAEMKFDLLNPLDFLCTASTCPVRDGEGRPLMKDFEHLTAYSSRSLAGFVDRTVSLPVVK